MTTNEQLTEELHAAIALVRTGATVNVQLDTAFSGTQLVRLEEVRYGGNARPLKPKTLLSAVIVGAHEETLRTIADMLGAAADLPVPEETQ